MYLVYVWDYLKKKYQLDHLFGINHDWCAKLYCATVFADRMSLEEISWGPSLFLATLSC